MLSRLEINFIHAEHDENIRKYVQKKIGRLDRFLPRAAQSAPTPKSCSKREIRPHDLQHIEAWRQSDNRIHCCEVTLHLPHDTINVSETSINMFTAVDIVEHKLKIRSRSIKNSTPVPSAAGWRPAFRGRRLKSKQL